MCFDENKSRAISRAGSRFTVRTSSDSSSESSLKSSESEFLDFRFFFPFFPAFSFFLSESSSSSESSPESSEFLAFRFRPLVDLSFFGLASISSISESESATIRFNISAFYFGMFFSKSWGFLRRPQKNSFVKSMREISLNFAAFSEYMDFMTR